MLKLFEQRIHALEQPGLAGDILPIDLKQALAQRLEFSGRLVDAETVLDQGDAAVGDHRTDALVGLGGAALLQEHRVQGVGQIRRGIGQGAVEVEEDGFDVRSRDREIARS